MACWMRAIEDGYKDNPYHSSTHAAGVLQMTHMLLTHGLMSSGAVDATMQLACYIAGELQPAETSHTLQLILCKQR